MKKILLLFSLLLLTGCSQLGEVNNGITQKKITVAGEKVEIGNLGGSLTFGYTEVKSTAVNLKNNIYGTGDTPVSSGTVTSITVYLNGWGSGEKVKCAIYTNPENALIAQTEELTTGGSNGWYTFNISPGVSITNRAYRIVAWSDSDVNVYYGIQSGGLFPQKAVAYGAWADPQGFNSSTGYVVSIYATYTIASAPSYCGHTGGDWYVNSECWISTSTTTPGNVYIGAGGSLNCVDGAVISAKSRSVGNGGSYSVGDGCAWSLWTPN